MLVVVVVVDWMVVVVVVVVVVDDWIRARPSKRHDAVPAEFVVGFGRLARHGHGPWVVGGLPVVVLLPHGHRLPYNGSSCAIDCPTDNIPPHTSQEISREEVMKLPVEFHA